MVGVMCMKNWFFTVLIAGSLNFINGTNVVLEERCKNPVHSNCSLDTTSMTLWCDNTNFTALPGKHGLHRFNSKYFAPPHKATFVLFNHSCIKTIRRDHIAEYKHMELLDLQENFIKILRVDTFGSSDTLQKLYLSKNQIEKIEPATFKKLKNLMLLHLGNNQLDKIHPKTFFLLSKLEVLKINNNKLKEIDSVLFRDLTNLKELDLSKNNLETFYPDRLKHLTKLKVLNLQGNKLKQFDAKYALLASPKLIDLNLNSNQISCFDDDAFSEHDLYSLRIAGNPLKIPREKWFSKLVKHNNNERFIELSAAGSWECNCKAYPYMVYLNVLRSEYEEVWLNRLDVVCHNPPALRGKKLKDLNWSEIKTNNNCTNPEETFRCAVETKIEKPVRPVDMESLITKASKINSNIIRSLTLPLTEEHNLSTSKVSHLSSVFSTIKPFTERIELQKSELKIEYSIFISLAIFLIIVVVLFLTYQKRKYRLNNNKEKNKPSKRILNAKEQKPLRNSRKDTECTILSESDSSSSSLLDCGPSREVGVGSSRTMSIQSDFPATHEETRVKELIENPSDSNRFESTSNHTYQSVGSQSFGGGVFQQPQHLQHVAFIPVPIVSPVHVPLRQDQAMSKNNTLPNHPKSSIAQPTDFKSNPDVNPQYYSENNARLFPQSLVLQGYMNTDNYNQ